MNTSTAGFSDPTVGRVMLPRVEHGGPRSPAGLTMDCALDSAPHPSRVVAYRDEDTDCVSLVVGDATGADDVPVRTVPEEQLILEGYRSRAPVAILVGVPDGSDARMRQRELERQLCAGGPLRSMLAYSGARSVVVEWLPGTPSSSPDARPLIRARP